MKIKKLLAVTIASATAMAGVASLAACGKKEESTPEPETKYTVEWYDGTEKIKTSEVAESGVAPFWTPDKKGYSFDTWYSDAECTTRYVFGNELTGNIKLYAKYTESIWSCSGGGKGTLSQNGWSPSNYALKATIDSTNTTYSLAYKITLTMYENDAFRFTNNGDWDTDAGIGYMDGFKEDAEPNGDGNKTGKVTLNDVVYFKGTQEFGKNAEHWNITCVKDGVYDFVLGFGEDGKPSKIEWTRTGDAAEMTETHEMYLIGSFNSWTQKDTNYKMKEVEDGKAWTTILHVTTDTAEAKLFNGIGNAYYPDGGNLQLTKGDWMFRISTEDNSVSYEKMDYYLVGTLKDGDSNVNFAVKKDFSPKLTTADDGATYTTTVTVADMTADYDWLKDGNVMAIKCMYGSSVTNEGATWFSSAETGDNYYFKTADIGKQFVITLNIANNTFTVTPVQA